MLLYIIRFAYARTLHRRKLFDEKKARAVGLVLDKELINKYFLFDIFYKKFK